MAETGFDCSSWSEFLSKVMNGYVRNLMEEYNALNCFNYGGDLSASKVCEHEGDDPGRWGVDHLLGSTFITYLAKEGYVLAPGWDNEELIKLWW